MSTPHGIIAEQEATIQKLKERLIMWAEILDGDGDWTQEDAARVTREMRETAEQL